MAPVFTIPSATNRIPSEGSIGDNVFPPNQPYFFPINHSATCKMMSICTTIKTVQRILECLRFGRTGSAISVVEFSAVTDVLYQLITLQEDLTVNGSLLLHES